MHKINIYILIWPYSSVWLERQPVTLEVDGSSPFGVAKFIYKRLYGVKCLGSSDGRAVD